MNAVRKDAVDLLNFIFHPFNHRRGVGAEQLDGHSSDDLALTIARLQSAPDGSADFHLGDIAQIDGTSVFGFHHNGVEVVDARCQPDGADDQFLRIFFDELRTDIEVVRLDPVDDFVKRQVIAQQIGRIDIHMILLFVSTDAEHLGDAGNGLEVELDDPVLNGAQLFEGAFAGGVVQIIEEHQAHAGRNRPHTGFTESFGNLLARLGQPFADHLAAEVDIQSVLEVDVHHGEAEVGDTANLFHAGQTRHRGFDRIGDIFFHLFGRQPFGGGEDLNQIRGDIREGVHGELPITEETGNDNQ